MRKFIHMLNSFSQALGIPFLFHLMLMKPYELGVSIIPFIKESEKSPSSPGSLILDPTDFASLTCHHCLSQEAALSQIVRGTGKRQMGNFP